MSEVKELPLEARRRIAEAVRWHRCWRCMHAPCSCPPGVGLGQVPAGGEALTAAAPARKLRQDPEQVRPGSYTAPKRRRAGGRR